MSKDKITILLSTYNGEKYLRDLLDSLKRQTYQNIEIIARDDCSSDNSIGVLNSYEITLVKSEKNIGVKESFSTLLGYALKRSNSDYFMFCDQDDVWENSKVEKSLKLMKNMKKKYGDIPLLVHSDLAIVDRKLNNLNKSFFDYENIQPNQNSFNKLLVQNTITGCTMLINRELAKLSYAIPKNSIMHDWWIGLVASYFGKIDFLKEPLIKYRQHITNTIGAKKFSLGYILDRFFYSQNILDKNIAQASIFLQRYENILDNETKELLKNFVELKDKSFFDKRRLLIKHGIYKQGIIRNLGLFIKI